MHIRNYNSKKIRDEVIRKSQAHIKDLPKGFGAKKLTDFMEQFDKKKKKLIPREEYYEQL